MKYRQIRGFFASLAICLLSIAGLFAPHAPHAAHAVAPVLVLTDSSAANPFGQYTSEILRGEGLFEFEHRDRAAWSGDSNAAANLSNYSAVVMSEMSLSVSEQQLLRNYVQAGGVLIGARPDRGLSDVFGIQFAGDRPERTLQYFGVDGNQRPGEGITQGALQYHGIASNYNLQGATGLAYLYANPTTPTDNPAVTTHNFGQGKAIAFAFDPAKSVVLTRQGNPDWQNTEGDGIDQYRPHDFFTRNNSVISYYDPSRIAIPHADELQRLLANTLIDANKSPLPRMWYLPGTHKTLMVNTGDGEGNSGSYFNNILADAASYGGKFTVYLRDIGVENTSVAQEARWRAEGNEVGVHVYAGGGEGAGAVPALSFAYNNINNNLESKFGHISRTARSHTIDWTGWVDMARIEANRGTQLDTNFYHFLNGNAVDPLTTNGYFTGSGLPQRFIDEGGQMLDIYQAATQWPDEWFADNGFTAEQSYNVMKTMFETAESQGYYSTFVNNVHPVRYEGADGITHAWANAIWAYAEAHDIPMWSAEMLLDFRLARDASQFENIAYSSGKMEFDYTAGDSGFDLSIMIPLDWADQQLKQILVDGVPVEWTAEEIKGIAYGLVTTQAGQAHVAATYASLSLADFNRSGFVDNDDLTIWHTAYGVDASADANGDSTSDGLDFLAWQRQFASSPAASSTTAVPEPTTLGLLSIGALVLVMRLKRTLRMR